MQSPVAGRFAWLVALGPLVLGAGPARGDAPPTASLPEGGVVVALRGEAFTGGEGQERRLACNDTLELPARLVTAAGAGLALLVEDVYLQLGPDSALELERGAEGGIELRLRAGRLRVLDSREAEGVGPVGLRALDLAVRATGSDVEAWVMPGGGARLCAWEGPLEVGLQSRGATLTLESGSCARSLGGSRLRYETSAPEPLRVAALASCEAGDISHRWAAHFAPGDVSAPPLTPPRSLPPIELGGVPREPCDQPGLRCGAGLAAPRFGEPPGLDGGPFPGSGGSRFGEPPGLAGGSFPGTGGNEPL